MFSLLIMLLQILEANRDLYYARFHIHYLGWAHRFDEWVAEEVIHGVVDRSRPNFNVKSLKVGGTCPRHTQDTEGIFLISKGITAPGRWSARNAPAGVCVCVRACALTLAPTGVLATLVPTGGG